VNHKTSKLQYISYSTSLADAFGKLFTARALGASSGERRANARMDMPDLH